MSTPVVLDNGAGFIKLAWGEQKKITSPNCIVRSKEDRTLYFGHEIQEEKMFDTLQYRRPHEKGFLTNWETQKAIWDALFQHLVPEGKAKDSLLILTETIDNLSNLQANCDEMVFENYEFAAYIRCCPASLIPWGDLPDFRTPEGPACHEVVLVVDSGFSCTRITPVIQGIPSLAHSRRIDVGGKFLTNALKETISYRQYNMMEETSLINQVKESCCFVSPDFHRDMELAKEGKLLRTFLLPDIAQNTPGRALDPASVDISHATMKQDENDDNQFLTLRYESFSIPELLFRPSDIGMPQMGIAEATLDALSSLPDHIRALALANVVLIGGSTKFQGFAQRFRDELRALAPQEFTVRVYLPPDPVTYARDCGMRMAQDSGHIAKMAVTRQEYLSSNKRATLRFNADLPAPDSTATPQTTTVENTRRRESRYDETSDRSDTPRSFSPDTEPELELDKGEASQAMDEKE